MNDEYLTFEQARQLIEKCCTNKWFIHGADRFIREEDGSLVPDMRGILDTQGIPLDDYQAALEFTREYMSTYGKDERELFDFVVENGKE